MKPYLYAFIAIVLWANLALLSLQLTQVPPFLLVGVSLTIGSVCGLRWIRDWKVSWPTLALGIYGLFGYHFFLFMGLRNAPPVEANLINYLWPLLIVVMSPLFFKNFRLNYKHLLAAALGFAGAFLIVTGGSLSMSSSGLLGYAFAGIAAFMWASYSLLTKKVAPFPTGAVGLFCFVSGLLSILCHFLLEPAYTLQATDVLPFLLLGLGPMGAAFFLWDKSLKTGDPRVIGSLSYLTPMLSTLLLTFFGGGHLTWMSLVSMGLILIGAAIGAVANK